jgi:hypothetical protein
MNYWYSTQALLSWCLNRYFYGDVHFAHVAAPFHPYRLANPPSSRPHELYQRLYEGAHDRDIYNDTIRARRDGLHAGITFHGARLAPPLTVALHRVVDDIDPIFFTPVVYRVNLEAIPGERVDSSAGTRSRGIDSNERLIADLASGEFAVILLADNAPDLKTDLDVFLIASPLITPSGPAPTPAEVISALLGRCI